MRSTCRDNGPAYVSDHLDNPASIDWSIASATRKPNEAPLHLPTGYTVRLLGHSHSWNTLMSGTDMLTERWQWELSECQGSSR
jgi:hypothetical protein